jgi:hypothetical protein
MWDATTATRYKQEKRASGSHERFNKDLKAQTFKRVRVRVAAAGAGQYHLAVAGGSVTRALGNPETHPLPLGGTDDLLLLTFSPSLYREVVMTC